MKPAPQHQYSIKTRGSKTASQLHYNNQDVTRSLRPYISTVPRHDGRNPCPSCTVITKTWLEARILASLWCLDARFEACVSTSLQSQDAEPQACVWQSSKPASSKVRSRHPKREARSPRSDTEKLCVSVITALITGSITAHVMRGVNPHYGGLLGDSFTAETPINNSVCYWRGIESFKKNQNKSSTLLTTCWLQVCSYLKSPWDFIGQELL